MNPPTSTPNNLMNFPQITINNFNNNENISENSYEEEEDLKSEGDKNKKNHRNRAIKWSHIEDRMLLDAIYRFGSDKWALIAQYVGNGRTRSQCSQRWHRVLSPSISRANWSKDEDDLLIRKVQEYGVKSWKRVSRELGSRSDTQCRYRYKQLCSHKKISIQETIPNEKKILPSIWSFIEKK